MIGNAALGDIKKTPARPTKVVTNGTMGNRERLSAKTMSAPSTSATSKAEGDKTFQVSAVGG